MKKYIFNQAAMTLIRASAIASCFVMTAFQAQSATPVVVELYTSQGCSSCPPADKVLAKLTKDPNVIALSMHVDYWDYIGWKDTFAQEQFSARQREYATYVNDRSVYTPQMIINGMERVVGSDSRAVSAGIKSAASEKTGVDLRIKRTGGTLTIDALARSSLDTKATIQLVRFTPEQRVRIKRGENAGREIEYHNVVTTWDVVGTWSGDRPIQLKVPVRGNQSLAVIVQSEGPGEILAAAQLN